MLIHLYVWHIHLFRASKDMPSVDAASSGGNLRSFIPQFSVFLYTLFLQWSVAFAVVLVFFLDWFAVSYIGGMSWPFSQTHQSFQFEFHPQGSDADYSNQRTTCAVLGLWLVTIAGYSIVLGAQSMVGWVLATSSLAMAKFAIQMNWGESYDVSLLPSLPIYSSSSFDMTALDALILVGFAGWLVLYFKAPEKNQSTTDNEWVELSWDVTCLKVQLDCFVCWTSFLRGFVEWGKVLVIVLLTRHIYIVMPLI